MSCMTTTTVTNKNYIYIQKYQHDRLTTTKNTFDYTLKTTQPSDHSCTYTALILGWLSMLSAVPLMSLRPLTLLVRPN